MDSTPEDDVAVISKFLSRLQSNLTEETDATAAIEQRLDELFKRFDIEFDKTQEIKRHGASSAEANPNTELSEADALRTENIKLILALQRQDFLTAHYEKVLNEHQDLLDSINNSIINRKSYVDSKTAKDDLNLKQRITKLEEEAIQLKNENQACDVAFNRSITDITEGLQKTKHTLDPDDAQEAEVLAKLASLEQLLHSR